MIRKLFRNAHIVTPQDSGKPLAGKKQGLVAEYPKGAILCSNGLIERIGTEQEVLDSLSPKDVDQEINCKGLLLIPGLVDPHTHMCFAETREAEFCRRMQGESYLEILQKGGGILSSVRAVREVSEEDLFQTTLSHVRAALSLGTTTLEIKSGYGLNTETELKQLRVIDRIRRETALDVAATFLGAHAVAPEYAGKAEDYVELILREMLPAVVRQGIARFCDVFCEQGVFDLSQSRRILKAAQEMGLGIKIHADEVHDLGGAGLAAELGAVSADHLLAAGDPYLARMAQAGVIGVLLPATAYSLRKPFAQARKMIELGLPLALATDCNPGSSYTESMPFVFGLAVIHMGMSPSEALVASTLNGAYALGLSQIFGSLDTGKQADFLLVDGDSPAIFAYHCGVSSVKQCYKKGELCCENH
jgi:imidazolonepropionase